MMLLQRIKAHLIAHKVSSLFELKREFAEDPALLRDMLQVWIIKGKVRAAQKTAACGVQCSKCDPLLTELYEWVDCQ
ncbi:MAG: FeoC-like transcriptional regulator [Pseudomonadota bacterium]|nr:FeoC-like transcriptional regulator [Pseudomonadota bacterium]